MKTLKELEKHPFWKDFTDAVEALPPERDIPLRSLWDIFLAGAVRYKLYVLLCISRTQVEDIKGEAESKDQIQS